MERTHHLPHKDMTMVNLGENKAEKERIIFQLFVKVAHLPVIPDSIRSEPPPAPDISCEITGRGSVAFELVEIVTPALMQVTESGQMLRKAFKTACERHPEIATRFHDAFIYIGFRSHAPIQQCLSVVTEVVDVLLKHPETSLKYIRVPHKLQKILGTISVERGVSNGPVFEVTDMTKVTDDEIFEQIGKKYEKTYSSDRPIELLAYYITQPSPDSFDWQSGFHDYVLKNFSRGPFKRIWVYDHCMKSITYIHPDPDKESRT
ncbi:MAG: hypothetical protein E8D47_01285 [Nitrospira sp.]|nr:MAG: hypothetical protein E8D47_01285 [Nitrospira sp.]